MTREFSPEIEINEITLKVSGKGAIAKELEIGGEYKVTGTLAIFEKSFRDNQDGTQDIVFKGKWLTEVQVEMP